MRRRLGRTTLWRSAILTAIMLGALAWSRPIQAQVTNASPWFGLQSPRLEQLSDVAPAARSNYNSDCTQTVGTTGSGATIEGCARYTPYGTFLSGYLQLSNTSAYGLLYEAVWPVPNNSTVLRPYQGTPTIGSIYAITDYPSKLTLHTASDGQIYYNPTAYQPVYLKDSHGELLNIDYSSISFSRNGDWLVAIANGMIARVNLRTFETILFDEPYYQDDINFAQTAITNDGRYAVLSSSYYGRFRLFDLQACTTRTNGSLDCPSRDVLSDLPPRLSGDLQYLEIRFVTDNILTFYRREQFSDRLAWSRYTLTAGGQPEAHFEYLALGDSFASGEGAHDYKPDTDTTSNTCHTSRLAYPYLIRAALHLNTAESIACSGAKLDDITNTSPTYKGQVKDGLRRQERNPSPIIANFLPGYLAQTEVVAASMPRNVTVSISGNDIGFGKRILRCAEPDTCYSSYEDRLEIVREINSKFDKLTATYAKLKADAGPSAHVYALGYPELAKNGGNCAVNVRLNAEEIIFSNLFVDYINRVIQRASQKAGVAYIDISHALWGHRLCEASPNNLAVNGVTAGNDTFNFGLFKGPFGSESYHPTALGHRLLEETILQATADLSRPMPAAILDLTPPSDADATTFLQAPHTYRPVYRANYDEDLANDVITRETWWHIIVDGSKAFFRPDSTVRVMLHSEPISLGNFQTDARANLAADIQIPASTSEGFHTLHLYGENLAGEAIDVYKILYVPSSGNSSVRTSSSMIGVSSGRLTYPLAVANHGPGGQLPPAAVAANPGKVLSVSGVAVGRRRSIIGFVISAFVIVLLWVAWRKGRRRRLKFKARGQY